MKSLTSDTNTVKIITIIGGTGQMGQLFARLWQQLGFIIHCVGSQDWQKIPALIEQSDAVIVSVPIHYTVATIFRIPPYLQSDTVLADFTSIKNVPFNQMLQSHTGPIVGLHPMFGPTINSPQQQVIVYCHGRDQTNYQWLLDSLAELQFSLKAMEAPAHDQAMNFIQGIEHCLTFCLGSFLHHKQQAPDQLIEIASPIYLTKLLLLGRIFDQDPILYADIIMADPQRIQLIREFSNWLSLWLDKIENHDKQSFIDEFTKTSAWMGDFTNYAQTVSDTFLTLDLDNICLKNTPS